MVGKAMFLTEDSGSDMPDGTGEARHGSRLNIIVEKLKWDSKPD
jgi:hypothetical protein